MAVMMSLTASVVFWSSPAGYTVSYSKPFGTFASVLLTTSMKDLDGPFRLLEE